MQKLRTLRHTSFGHLFNHVLYRSTPFTLFLRLREHEKIASGRSLKVYAVNVSLGCKFESPRWEHEIEHPESLTPTRSSLSSSSWQQNQNRPDPLHPQPPLSINHQIHPPHRLIYALMGCSPVHIQVPPAWKPTKPHSECRRPRPKEHHRSSTTFRKVNRELLKRACVPQETTCPPCPPYNPKQFRMSHLHLQQYGRKQAQSHVQKQR